MATHSQRKRRHSDAFSSSTAAALSLPLPIIAAREPKRQRTRSRAGGIMSTVYGTASGLVSWALGRWAEGDDARSRDGSDPPSSPVIEAAPAAPAAPSTYTTLLSSASARQPPSPDSSAITTTTTTTTTATSSTLISLPFPSTSRYTSTDRRWPPPEPSALLRNAAVGKSYRKKLPMFGKQAKEGAKQKVLEAIYEIKRAEGYSQDFETFKGYLEYKQRLESLDRPSPSKPTTPLRPSTPPRPATPTAASPSPTPTPLREEFLSRTLRRARDSFHSPRPRRPSLPSFDRLKLADEAIEKRLRKPKRVYPKDLTPEQQAEVSGLLKKRPGVLSKVGKEEMTYEHLARLRPGQWLNDEVINFYVEMVRERVAADLSAWEKDKSGEKPTDAFLHGTFFFSKLEGVGYDKARLGRWTKKVDILAKDIVVIPINRGQAHWVCAAINFRRKRFEFYDSMGQGNQHVFRHLREYIRKESLDKRKKEFDFEGWEDFWSPDTPQQENGYDCGVFTCRFIEALARGVEVDSEEGGAFDFDQKDMEYMRKRIICEIGRGKFLD